MLRALMGIINHDCHNGLGGVITTAWMLLTQMCNQIWKLWQILSACNTFQKAFLFIYYFFVYFYVLWMWWHLGHAVVEVQFCLSDGPSFQSSDVV